jgi:hypothetical protein
MKVRGNKVAGVVVWKVLENLWMFRCKLFVVTDTKAISIIRRVRDDHWTLNCLKAQKVYLKIK